MTSNVPGPVGGAADPLAAVVAMRELLERLEDAAVEGALRDGWTWPQIAEALGLTRQAVHKKHIKRLEHTDIDLRRRRG
jgi:Homeodomain-like domain-containing protein